MKKIIVPLAVATFLLCSCPTDETDHKPADVIVPADLMGMVHAGSGTPITGNDAIKARFDKLDDIGVVWMLDDFTWGEIQPASKKDETDPDNWNWANYDHYVKNANDRDKKVMAMMAYSVDWLHGPATGEQLTVKDHMGANATVDVHEDGHVKGSRCIEGPEEVARYCAYVSAVVKRYDGKSGHGKVDAFRIWNEPNLFPRFWTGVTADDVKTLSAEELRARAMENFWILSKAALKAAHEADPDALVGVGALNSIATDEWIRGLYTSGAVTGADWVAFHPYSLNATGTTGVLQQFIDKSDAPFRGKVWVTEVGHPTSGGDRTPEGSKAGYGTEVDQDLNMPQTIVKTITLMATQGVQKIFWYHLSDSVERTDTDSESWFGLYHRIDAAGNMEPKGKLPDAYKLVAKNIPGKTWKAAGLPGLTLPGAVQSYYFEGENEHCLVVWNTGFFSTPEVTIELPAGKNHKVYDLGGGIDNEWESAPAPDNKYTLSTLDSKNEKVLFFTWEN